MLRSSKVQRMIILVFDGIDVAKPLEFVHIFTDRCVVSRQGMNIVGLDLCNQHAVDGSLVI